MSDACNRTCHHCDSKSMSWNYHGDLRVDLQGVTARDAFIMAWLVRMSAS